MSTSTAELTLVIKARNLANAGIAAVGDAVDNIKTKAGKLAGAFRTAFAGMGSALGVFADDIAHGKNLQQAALDAGLMMGTILATNIGEAMIAKIAGSKFIAMMGVRFAALGTFLGGVIDTAISIAMAALPFVLIAVVAAAVVVLATNAKIRNQVIAFGKKVVVNIATGLAGLALKVLGVFGDMFRAVAGAMPGFIVSVARFFFTLPSKLISLGTDIVTTIVKGLWSLPGKVADVIRAAFSHLRIDIGPFHIRSTGVTIDLPHIDLTRVGGAQFGPRSGGQIYGPPVPHYAAGGWAGLHGPEMAMVGEHGPEYVRKAGTGTGDGQGAPVTIALTLDGKMVGRLIDERLYYLIRNASPASGQV